MGNIRAVVSGDGRVLETNNYYPYGMQIKPLSQTYYTGSDVKNRYKYNGKELFSDNGLDWLAYGKRFYDPVVARFWDLDPLADTFAYVTPYNYAENSPVANIDLWGTQKVPVKDYITEGMRFAGLSEDYIQEVNKFRAKSGATATVLSVATVVGGSAITRIVQKNGSLLTKSAALKGGLAGTVDFMAQLTANRGKLKEVNFTQTLMTGGLGALNISDFSSLVELSFTSSVYSSAFEIKTSGLKSTLNDKKSFKTFFIQTTVGTIGNIVGGLGEGGKSAEEVITCQLPNYLPGTVVNTVQNNLIQDKKLKQ